MISVVLLPHRSSCLFAVKLLLGHYNGFFQIGTARVPMRSLMVCQCLGLGVVEDLYDGSVFVHEFSRAVLL